MVYQDYIFQLMISPYLSAQTGTVNRSLFTFSTISVLGQYLAYLMLSVYCWLTVGNVLAFFQLTVDRQFTDN